MSKPFLQFGSGKVGNCKTRMLPEQFKSDQLSIGHQTVFWNQAKLLSLCGVKRNEPGLKLLKKLF